MRCFLHKHRLMRCMTNEVKEWRALNYHKQCTTTTYRTLPLCEETNKRNTWISSQMTLNRNSWALFPSHMITSDLRRMAQSFQESYQRRRWYCQGPHRRPQLIHSGHCTVSAVCCQRLDLDLKFLPMFLLTLRLAGRTERFDLRSWWVVLREIIFTNES